jgi:hypothetical protein
MNKRIVVNQRVMGDRDLGCRNILNIFNKNLGLFSFFLVHL